MIPFIKPPHRKQKWAQKLTLQTTHPQFTVNQISFLSKNKLWWALKMKVRFLLRQSIAEAIHATVLVCFCFLRSRARVCFFKTVGVHYPPSEHSDTQEGSYFNIQASLTGEPSVPVTCHRCCDICMCSVRSRRAGFMHRRVFCQRMNSLSKASFWEMSWLFQHTAGLIEKVEMQNNDWGVFFLSLSLWGLIRKMSGLCGSVHEC